MTERNGHPKQMILAAYFPGVNNTTVWHDPRSKSQIEIESFIHLAQTAERGKLDFFFLAEGLRLREQRGKIHDLDTVGRPDTLAVLAALAAVTTHLGLAGTLNATFHEPYEMARQLATLDHLSGGRAAWNVVTSSDAFTGENFRRGGFLDHADRYLRAGEFVDVCRELWASWAADEIVADQATGEFLRQGAPGEFAHHGAQFDIHGRFNVPRSPQVDPVILQAGDSDGGRELAARTADAIFTRHGTLPAGQAFCRDVKRRLATYGREPDELKVLPAVSIALGDTPEEAAEYARYIRRQQVSPQTAILLLEQVWNRDLSAYDPEGPLPDIDPDVSADSIIQGRARMHDDRMATATKWREIAEAKNLSIRDLIITTSGRINFVGTPSQVAEAMDEFVQQDASDGFVLAPYLTPGGLDDFVDQVVPLLQERGVLRHEYTGTTLRDHMGLPPAGRMSSPDDGGQFLEQLPGQRVVLTERRRVRARPGERPGRRTAGERTRAVAAWVRRSVGADEVQAVAGDHDLAGVRPPLALGDDLLGDLAAVAQALQQHVGGAAQRRGERPPRGSGPGRGPPRGGSCSWRRSAAPLSSGRTVVPAPMKRTTPAASSASSWRSRSGGGPLA